MSVDSGGVYADFFAQVPVRQCEPILSCGETKPGFDKDLPVKVGFGSPHPFCLGFQGIPVILHSTMTTCVSTALTDSLT